MTKRHIHFARAGLGIKVSMTSYPGRRPVEQLQVIQRLQNLSSQQGNDNLVISSTPVSALYGLIARQCLRQALRPLSAPPSNDKNVHSSSAWTGCSVGIMEPWR